MKHVDEMVPVTRIRVKLASSRTLLAQEGPCEVAASTSRTLSTAESRHIEFCSSVAPVLSFGLPIVPRGFRT